MDRSGWTEAEEIDNVKNAINGEVQWAGHSLKPVAIKEVTGKAPRGWYYGMVSSRAGARSRSLVAKVFKEEGLPLKYYSDDYSDDLPHWIPSPNKDGQGLLIVPYA